MKIYPEGFLLVSKGSFCRNHRNLQDLPLNYIASFRFSSALGKGSQYSGKCDDINIELKINDLDW